MTKRNTKRGMEGAALVGILLLLTSCFQENRRLTPQKTGETAREVSGELFRKLEERGLSSADAKAALKTFVPTGGHDTHIGILTTGASGRIAIFGVPSMRIIKYVGLFTPEPWQGFAYDDESKLLLRKSAREDLEYAFGDSGEPAVSRTRGQQDGRALFVADAANGRVGIIHMDDFEAKQVVTNPVFRTSGGMLAITPDTEYVLQATEAPEIPGGGWVDPDTDLQQALRGGLTFWPYEKKEGHFAGQIDADEAFTIALPPYLQGEIVAGHGASAGRALVIGRCRGPGFVPGQSTCKPEQPGVLHVVNVATAERLSISGRLIDGHSFVSLNDAIRGGAVYQLELPAGPSAMALSPDGRRALVVHESGNEVTVVDLERLIGADGVPATTDAFGLQTHPLDVARAATIDVGGVAVDAVFVTADVAFVSVAQPGRIVRLDLKANQVTMTQDLDVPGGRLIMTGAGSTQPEGRYLITLNKKTHGRYVSVGPQRALNPILFDVSGDGIVPLFDMVVPQATDLAGVLMPSERLDTIVRYALGTDTRSGELSPFRTLAGEERIERKDNRVHVFGTLIRSHITPETVEVEVGDIVTFHLTNLEQAQDQTHGFTVDTYNVHGSLEPGKVASMTFVADTPGVFPYYCTEFCSALHLEMMGYLLVKPKNYQPSAEDETDKAQIDPAEAKRRYEQKVATIETTQGVINSVVKWLKENDFESDERAAALVQDAVYQLGEAEKIQPKIDAATQSQDWPSAMLWADQLYMYQVKAADAGLRAKKILEEKGE